MTIPAPSPGSGEAARQTEKTGVKVISLPPTNLYLIHFSPGDFERVNQAATDAPTSAKQESEGGPLGWYLGWVLGCVGQAQLVLPASARGKPLRLPEQLLSGPPIWYDERGVEGILPESGENNVWLINGGTMPMIDWDEAARATASEQAEALFFGPPGSVSTAHYPESLIVDQTGRVLKVERHYFDSPVSTEVSFGPACLVVARGPSAAKVVGHLLSAGWSLDSVSRLSQSVRTAWCSVPGVLSSLDGAAEEATRTLASLGDDAATAWLKFGRPQTVNTAPGVRTLSESNTRSEKPVASPDAARSADRAYFFVKRGMDLVLACLSILVLSPFLAAVAILVKMTSPGPVFYGDIRQGRGGREFRCLKFRTMVANAAALQADLRARNEVDGPQFKMSNDPRLTPIGKWLRRYNIDELPQLFNVLAGEMSLVGPRPSPDRENQLCPGWRRTRLSLRPGITGLWQVLRLRGDAPSDFQEWIYYDVEYARHRSIWLDVQLLIYTPLTMISPRILNRFAERLARRGICTHSVRLQAQQGTAGEQAPRVRQSAAAPSGE